MEPEAEAEQLTNVTGVVCPVCAAEPMTAPRVMDCGHSACTECLRLLAQSARDVRRSVATLLCPVCQRAQALDPEEGVFELPFLHDEDATGVSEEQAASADGGGIRSDNVQAVATNAAVEEGVDDSAPVVSLRRSAQLAREGGGGGRGGVAALETVFEVTVVKGSNPRIRKELKLFKGLAWDSFLRFVSNSLEIQPEQVFKSNGAMVTETAQLRPGDVLFVFARPAGTAPARTEKTVTDTATSITTASTDRADSNIRNERVPDWRKRSFDFYDSSEDEMDSDFEDSLEEGDLEETDQGGKPSTAAAAALKSAAGTPPTAAPKTSAGKAEEKASKREKLIARHEVWPNRPQDKGVEGEKKDVSSAGKDVPAGGKEEVKLQNTPAVDPTVGEDGAQKEMRAAVFSVLGHVDTGKTSLLDSIRRTSYQRGEAGFITQQIGATYVSKRAVEEATAPLNHKFKFLVDGLLAIDTPGHESFTNMRSRGSTLCDIAVLVIDIQAGLQAQTVESLMILKKHRVPFVIALNKIDRIFNWKSNPGILMRENLKRQLPEVRQEVEQRTELIIAALAEQGLNCCLYFNNKDFIHNISIVPTSAMTREGVPDLLLLLILLSQNHLYKQLQKKTDLDCIVMEAKVSDNVGASVDVILRSGKLKEGDRIAMQTLEGPIVTSIRQLTTGASSNAQKGLAVREEERVREVEAVQGVKILAKNLDQVIPGSRVFRCEKKRDEKIALKLLSSEMKRLDNRLTGDHTGVFVAAGTLGGLEALLDYLHECDIPVCGYSLGPVHPRDLQRVPISGWNVILVFNTPLSREVKLSHYSRNIIESDIIYSLVERFRASFKNLLERNRSRAITPCILSIHPDRVIKTTNPIIVGCKVEGEVRVGMPLCVPSLSFAGVGRVTAIKRLDDGRSVTSSHNDSHVLIKIDNVGVGGGGMVYGRDFDAENRLYCDFTDVVLDADLRSVMTSQSLEASVRWTRSFLQLFGFKVRQKGPNQRPQMRFFEPRAYTNQQEDENYGHTTFVRGRSVYARPYMSDQLREEREEAQWVKLRDQELRVLNQRPKGGGQSGGGTYKS